jgi:ferredoxin
MVGVNQAWCIACGLCFGVHSDLFEVWADGKAQIKKLPITDEEIDEYEEAKGNCPVQAIE